MMRLQDRRFFYEFRNSIMKNTTWEGVFRVRTSKDWDVKKIIGNYSVRTSNLLNTALIDENYTLTYLFERLNNPQVDYFSLQTVLLYTTSDGGRRIRVHNLKIPLTSDIIKIGLNADPYVTSLCLFRIENNNLYQGLKVSDCQQNLIKNTKEIVQQFDKNSFGGYSLFTCQMLSIIKHQIFNSKIEYTQNLDFTNYLRMLLSSLPVEEAIIHFTPYFFRLDNIVESNTCIYDENEAFVFPNMLNLSRGLLLTQFIYMMDDGINLVFYIGKYCDHELLQRIIGVDITSDDVPHIVEDMLYYDSNEPLNELIYNLITELRSIKSRRYSPVIFVIEGERTPRELDFNYRLIEDKVGGYLHGFNMDLKEFHKHIGIFS